MPKQTLTTTAALLGRTTALSLAALLTAGGTSPVQAQKVLRGNLAGILAPGVLTAVVADPAPPVVRVHSASVLVATLQNPNFSGVISIPADVQWDMSAYSDIPVHSGVSLIGERGALGSRPLLYTTNKSQDVTLFDITGNNVRVEGLHLQGPATGNRASGQKASSAIHILEDADHQLGRDVVVTDNELNEWTVAGIGLAGAHSDVALPGDYDPSWAVLRPEDAGLVRIEGNFIHNNCMDGLGYGVVVGGGAYVTIEGNVFDYNRHDVACDGHAHCGYVARYNYVLEGGFKEGEVLGVGGYYNQHFDVHGTRPSGSHHDGGAAGEYFLISNNTIRGAQTYGVWPFEKTRPAFELRGRPAIGAFFQENITVHDDFGAAIRLNAGDDSSLDESNPNSFNLHASGNEFGTDHSMEIATGDFDGDGRTDVFLATGTAWFFSRGGSQPWTYLQPSRLLTRDLAFADIDNDGSTDVLWRGGDGTLYYSKSGKGGPVALTSVPVAASELRFGDFDGDGKTDIFYTQGGAWNIWSSRTRTWSSPGGSSFPLSALLFGDFDGDGRTDVAGVENGHWSYSSAAAQPWAKLNSKLTSSFAGAVVGDFDGDGRPDIAWNAGSNWYYSSGGRGPSTLLRSGSLLDPYAPVASLLPGHFDGGRRTELVSFERQLVSMPGVARVAIGNHLVIWRAAGGAVTTNGNVRDHRGAASGTGDAFVLLSAQEMR